MATLEWKRYDRHIRNTFQNLIEEGFEDSWEIGIILTTT
jgi:hypothetical protein